MRYKIHRNSDAKLVRATIVNKYVNKYYNMFMNKYIIDGIDYQSKHYILKKMWGEGKLCAFPIKNTRTEGNPLGMLAFAPYAIIRYNYLDFPIEVSVVNIRGVAFFPVAPQEVDKDVVIGWAQPNFKPIYDMAKFYSEKIADVEMLIRTQCFKLKLPWLVSVCEEDKSRMKDLMEDILSDEEVIYLDSADKNSLGSITLPTPYIIDKLYNYKEALENEFLTYLGLNNNGVQEKKEHMITDEVNANNEVIEQNADSFVDLIQEFFDRINALWGYNLTITAKKTEQNNEMIEEEDEEDE